MPVGKAHKVSLFSTCLTQQPLLGSGSFSGWLQRSVPLSCSECVGLLSIAAECLANHICYLLLPADTSIHLPGSLFSLSSQLLPVPFWSRSSFAQLCEPRCGLDPNLLPVPPCVHCTCWRFAHPDPTASGFWQEGVKYGVFLAQFRQWTSFFFLPSKAAGFAAHGGLTLSWQITPQTSAQLGRFMSAKEPAFLGMLKAQLLSQAFASQIVRKTLDLTFAVGLTF